MFARFKTKLRNFLLRGIRLEQGVIDHICQTQVTGYDAEGRCQPFRPSADDIPRFIHAHLYAELIGTFKFALKGFGVRGTLLLFRHRGQHFMRNDLYNLFNANTGTAFNQAFGSDGATWLRPTTILNPRFVRFNVTVDF